MEQRQRKGQAGSQVFLAFLACTLSGDESQENPTLRRGHRRTREPCPSPESQKLQLLVWESEMSLRGQGTRGGGGRGGGGVVIVLSFLSLVEKGMGICMGVINYREA